MDNLDTQNQWNEGGTSSSDAIISEKAKEIFVTFSDMGKSMKQQAREKVDKELANKMREARKKSRFRGFMFGVAHSIAGDIVMWRKGKKYYKEIQKDKWNTNYKGKRADLSSIHEEQDIEAELEFDKETDKYNEVYDAFQEVVHNFSRPNPTLTEWQFRSEINKVLNGTYNNNAVYEEQSSLLRQTLEANGINVENTATSLLKSAKVQRAQNDLTKQIHKALGDYENSNNDDAYKTAVKNAFSNFSTANSAVPQIFNDINQETWTKTIEGTESFEEIAEKMKTHTETIWGIFAETDIIKANLKIKFIKEGNTSNYTDTKDQKSRNRLFRPGERMADQRRYVRFPLKFASTAIVGWIWAGVASLTGLPLLLGSVALWWARAASKAAGHKVSQLKDRHKKQETELITQQTLSNDTYKNDKRLKIMSQYLNQYGNIAQYKTEMEWLLRKDRNGSPLNDNEKDKLFQLVSQIYAGLQFQKDTWHHAFSIGGSEDQDWSKREYTRSMEELHKLKRFGLEKLKLYGMIEDEKDIKQDNDDYDARLWQYKGKYEKFQKEFDKLRRKETTKTAIRTAAIYAGFATLGYMNEVLERRGGTNLDGDLSDGEYEYIIRMFEETQLALWDFDLDVSTIVSSLQDGDTITYDLFAGVDGSPASDTMFTPAQILSQETEIKDLLTTYHYDTQTTKTITDFLDNEITNITEYANDQWADAWNQNLFTCRNLESLKVFVEEIWKEGWIATWPQGKNIIVKEINFDQSSSIIGHGGKLQTDRILGWDINLIRNNKPHKLWDILASIGPYTENQIKPPKEIKTNKKKRRRRDRI